MNSAARGAALSPSAVLASGAWLSILFWGASFVAAKDALSGFVPYSMVALRFALGALLLYAWLALRGQPCWPKPADRARCVLLGVILGVHIAAQGYALYSTSAIHSGWIVGFCPVVIALGARVFLRESISWKSWLGIAVASTGLGLILWPKEGAWTQFALGDWIVFASTFTWAAYTLLSARVVHSSGALVASAAAMAIASLICALAALWEGRWSAGEPSLRAWLAVLFLGLCCSGLAFAFWNRALERFGAAQLSGLIYFQPLVTLTLSVLWLAEPLEWSALLGGLVVLWGVWLLARGKR